jgi:AcrR family transcriptional regulator
MTQSSPTKRRTRRPVRPRRSNAERSATTRGAIIDAAIELLFSRGHTATTTIAVASRAAVSRGAMLHHFPTRVALLIATAEHIVTTQREERRAKTRELGMGLKRYYAGADINWQVQKQPKTIALLEIMMATRSDPPLRKAFAPFIAQIREMRKQAASLVAADLGVTDQATVATMLDLHQATLRGLAIYLVCTQDEEAVESARRLFTHCSHTFAEALMQREKNRARGDARER